MLVGQIQEIRKEKAILTSNLLSLRRTTSDDDLLSTDDGSLDDMDTNCKHRCRISFNRLSVGYLYNLIGTDLQLSRVPASV